MLGARIYYVFFSWDQYKDNLLDIFNIREGGLAIYGGVITAVLVMWIDSRRKKISLGLLGDIGSIGTTWTDRRTMGEFF